MADAIGNASTTLAEVIAEFLEIVPNPIIAGGFAMAHHGVIRATVDIDVISLTSITKLIPKFESRGYRRETMQLPIGALDLLTKGNKGIDFIHLNNSKFVKSIEKRAVEGFFLKHPIRFVSIEDLIILKHLANIGRSKKMDEADLEILLKKSYDTRYVQKWLSALKRV